jgi:predicted aldo/keto reductase-like oxidoreductase
MRVRRFGKTELRPTVLTFGAMRVPPEQDEDPDAARQRAFATMRRALDEGINHIETARGYGPSEELIGAAIAEGIIRRTEFILTTKIAPTETADEFTAALHDSLARMHVDRLDNLDIHGINNDELLARAVDGAGTMGAVRKAMAEGLVDHLGFATHAPLEVILRAIATDEFESVNLHYYWANRRNLPAVELATAKDMGVFIISPTDKGGRLFSPPPRLVELCRPLSPIELNQRWLLSQPEVHTLSVGAARPEEFEAHLPGVSRDGALSGDELEALARLDAALSGLGATYCSFCHECLPCPEDVHIPEILRLRNLALAYDMVEFGRFRYGLFQRRDPDTGERVGGAGHWFSGAQAEFCTRCNECLPRCPLDLPIPDLLDEVHGILSGRAGKRLWE